MTFTAIFTAVKGLFKNWQMILIVVLAAFSVCAAVYASNKAEEVDTLSLQNKYAHNQLQAQSESITKLTELQDKVSEQMIYREEAKRLFSEQAEAILGELDELKETNRQYALCSESELPYRLDGLFDGPTGISNEDSSADSSGSVHKQNSSSESTSNQ